MLWLCNNVEKKHSKLADMVLTVRCWLKIQFKSYLMFKIILWNPVYNLDMESFYFRVYQISNLQNSTAAFIINNYTGISIYNDWDEIGWIQATLILS